MNNNKMYHLRLATGGEFDFASEADALHFCENRFGHRRVIAKDALGGYLIWVDADAAANDDGHHAIARIFVKNTKELDNV